MRKNISIFVCIFLGLSFLLTPALVAASYKEEALEYFFKAQGSPDSNEQIANYQKAIEIEPDFIEAYVNLSVLYLRIGKPDDAVRLLEYAHSRHSDNGMIKQHLVIAYINLGVNYYSAQRTQDEIVAYQKALEIDSKNVMATNNLSNAYNTLGVTLYNQKQMRASWEAFNNALVLNPDNHTAKNNLQRLFKGVPPPDSPTSISKTPTPVIPTPTPSPPEPVSTPGLTTEDIKNMVVQAISQWQNHTKIDLKGDEKTRIVQEYLASVEECDTDLRSLQSSDVEQHLFFYLNEVHYEGHNPEFVVCDPLQ